MSLRRQLILAAALVPTTAATIYNNGTPNGLGGANFNDFRVVKDSSLAANASISGLRFWTITTNSSQTFANLTWAIYANNAGLPGAVVQSGSASNVAAIVDGSAHRREIAASFNLTVGDYFIEFHTASAPDVAGPTSFFWATTADNATNRYRQGDLTSVPTIEVNPNLGSGLLHAAFQIDGTLGATGIPGPAPSLSPRSASPCCGASA